MQPPIVDSPGGTPERLDELSNRPVIGRPIRIYLMRQEQVLYLVVGGWNTVFGYGVWAALQAALGDRIHYLAIVAIAWPLAVLNAYLGYRVIVFRSRASMIRELPRFSIVYALALVGNLVVLPIALTILPLNIYVVEGLFAVLVVIGSYLGHKYYSFGGGRGATNQ